MIAEEYVLTIGQVRTLQRLALPMDQSKLCWKRGTLSDHYELANTCSPEKLHPGYDCIPTFTLEDIRVILPDSIHMPTMGRCKLVCTTYIRAEEYMYDYQYVNSKGQSAIMTVEHPSELLAAYSMLCILLGMILIKP